MSISLPPCTLHTRPLTHFAGLKIPVGERAAEEIPALWQTFMAQNPGQFMQGDAEFGVCIAGPAGTHYMAAVPIAENAQVPADWAHIRLPATTFAVFAHHEPVWRLRETIDAIFTPGALKHTHQPVNSIAFLECYTPEFNPQTGMGGMSIWVPIKAEQ